MKNRRPTVLMIVALAILAGCTTTGGKAVWLPPVGSTVQLQQDIAVGSRTRVYIQNGRALDRSSVSVNTPYCYLSLERTAPGTGGDFTLRPDAFEVVKSYRKRSLVSVGEILYAGRAGSDRTMSTIMELAAGAQPDVTRLVCARWGMMNEDGWPSIKEMQATLAPLIEIELSG